MKECCKWRLLVTTIICARNWTHIRFVSYFSSSASGRSSVMDYPHPLITDDNDDLNFDIAYDTKIGAWDKWLLNMVMDIPQ